MSDYQNNAQEYEEEIDLRELIMLLWKKKVLIISLTLIGAILAGIISVFFISPVYETKLNIVISMPEMYVTQYGEYKMPITSNKQYIDFITSRSVITNTANEMGYDLEEVSVNSIRDRISIDNVSTNASVVQNNFVLTVRADNPEESLQLAETLYKNYIEYMDVMIRERAINYFYDAFKVKIQIAEDTLDKSQEIIEKNVILLAETPQVINQNELSQNVKPSGNDYIVIENVINPTYTDIEAVITANKQTIISIESELHKYNQALEELDVEKSAVDKYKESGRTVALESSIIQVVDTSIYLSSDPSMPKSKTSPSNSMNVAIGGVLGGMLSVMIVFFVAYWKKEL